MKFQYCPYCKSELKENEKTFICIKNDHVIYKNSIPAVSIVPIKNKEVLLAIRSIEPEKGKIDVIGGFTDPGEDPKDTAIRETMEETGLEIEILDLTGIYMSKYLFRGEHLDVMNIYYAVQAKGEAIPADDVSELIWYPIDQLPKENFAFDHLNPGLKDISDWLSNNQKL